MMLSSSREAARAAEPYFRNFPTSSSLESAEQIRRFELLRLAFFVLKLRKLEQRIAERQAEEAGIFIEGKAQDKELEFRRSLLRHVIFQQVLTLIQLDAREQAMQIIEACRKEASGNVVGR